MSDKELHHDLNELKALNMQGILLHLSTKEDLYQAKSELRLEIVTVKSELREEISAVKSELKNEISAVKSELRDEISEVKTSLKWANRFMITTLVGVIIGLIKLFWSHF